MERGTDRGFKTFQKWIMMSVKWDWVLRMMALSSPRGQHRNGERCITVGHKWSELAGGWSSSGWPDWAIFCNLGNFLKPLATINMPKSPTFLGNFCKGVKIYHFSSEINFGQLLQTFGDFYLVTLIIMLIWETTKLFCTCGNFYIRRKSQFFE